MKQNEHEHEHEHDEEEEEEEYVPVISQFIKRFREELPSSPSNRQHQHSSVERSREKEKFWWQYPQGSDPARDTDTVKERQGSSQRAKEGPGPLLEPEIDSSAFTASLFATKKTWEYDVLSHSLNAPPLFSKEEEMTQKTAIAPKQVDVEASIDLDDYANQLLHKCETLLHDYRRRSDSDEDGYIAESPPNKYPPTDIGRDETIMNRLRAPREDHEYFERRGTERNHHLAPTITDSISTKHSSNTSSVTTQRDQRNPRSLNYSTDANEQSDPMERFRNQDHKNQQVESSYQSAASYDARVSEDTSVFLHLSSSDSSSPSTPSSSPSASFTATKGDLNAYAAGSSSGSGQPNREYMKEAEDRQEEEEEEQEEGEEEEEEKEERERKPIVDESFVANYLHDSVVEQLWSRLRHIRKLKKEKETKRI